MEIKKYVENLVLELHKNIESDKYDVLLGDDASGRILTLILREIINEVRKRKGENEKIVTKFIAGGKGFSWNMKKIENAQKLLDKMKLEGKNVLVVTEYMFDGIGLLRIAKLLSQSGINFDCAVLATRYKKKYYLKKFSSVFNRKNLFIGNEQKRMPILYGDYELAGVRKGYYDDILTQKNSSIPQEYINVTRSQVKELSKEIVKEIWD